MTDDDILAKIKEGLYEVFPDAEGVELTAETPLDAIPGWDSMASVNLQMQLESSFECSVPPELLSGETTLGEVVEHIQAEAKEETQ